jgi:tRNA A-37 threonylcarbamoyl transferase component Bud32
MSEEKRCAQCGAVLPADAPQGLCPACLLKRGFATSTGGGESNKQGARTEYVPPPPAELARYFPELEILELIGRGGMGVVYKARQKRLDRLVALKILPPNVSRDAAFSERFSREAKALARLTHPNIVTVHDFGQADGLFYFVMEFVDGMNLRQLLDTAKISPKEALAIVPQICDALQFAHDKGIVHRDIKPENILIDKSGVVKIADFGLAKLVGLEAKDLTITSVRDVIGTPHYMAPEQIEHPQDVDHRADIYSLGVVFYQMLTGELPIGRFAPPSRKVQIDVRLDEVVLRALEKEPEQRYQHASDVRTQVETIATTAPKAGSTNLSRFSRTAIAGAVWALLWFAAMLSITLGDEQFPQAYNGWLRLLFFLGLAAPLGTTVSGWVTIMQIRRSRGQLRGLELAVFNGLVFALLGLDAFLGIAWLAAAKTTVSWRGLSGTGSVWHNLWDFAAWILVLIALAASLDFLITRRVWRSVNTPLGSATGKGSPRTRWVRSAFPVLISAALTWGVISFTTVAVILCARKVDNTNLPFVDDPEAIGQWTAVDFVRSPEDFAPESRSWKGTSLLFEKFVILPGGETSYPSLTWTKGSIINKGERTAASYEIRDIEGTNYLFMEWKNGDYLLFHTVPGYYVLRWIGGTIKSDYIGQTWFPKGDSIEITSVERTPDRMVVKGHYNLLSHDSAQLALYITTTNFAPVPTDPKQWMQITKGRGDFELTHPHLVAGLPHVSMYADGHPFAAFYFGTKAEALEESKGSWITNRPPAIDQQN